MNKLVKFPVNSIKEPAVRGSWMKYRGPVNSPMWGVVVPDGVFIVDLDTYKGVTREVVEREVGCALPWDNAQLQRTLHGGMHYAFNCGNAQLLQDANIAGIDGFDTRAAGKGYIATGQGYTELTPFGLDYALCNPDLLPTLPQGAIDYFSRSHSSNKVILATTTPTGVPDFATFLASQPKGFTIDQMVGVLAQLPDSAAAGPEWVKVGMAIWHETQGSEDGWIIFDEFSQRALDKYDVRMNRVRWDSFGNKSGRDPITFASVIDMLPKRSAVELPAVDEICDEAVKLKETMEFRLRSLLGVEDVSALQVSAAVLHLIITGVFWSPTGRDIRMLSSSENLNQHKGSDGFKFIRAKFGSVVDMDQLDAAIKISAGVNALDEERFTKTVHAAVAGVVMDYLEYNNQRNAIRYSSDMFATRSIMRLDRDCVNIVYEHTPLVAGSDVHAAVDPRVIVDFKEHFSRLDDLLKFIAAARFARDRKKAYLWIHAPSDWGKGLIIGALQSLDCAVEVSMEDIERMLEGAPSGHSPESFKRKFVLSLNEVKSIKRELKEVERTLRMSPKFQMATTVDVYTKLLWSADNIPSLVGEEGVEDQLANRISVFKEEGCRLDDRALAIEVGMPTYYDNVVYYIRDTLNALLDGYIAMGRADAERAAQTYLNDFHAQYNIGKMYGVLSEALPAMANQLIADIKAIPFNEQMDAGVRHVGATNDWYITAPRKFVNDWIFKTYSRSEMAMHAPKVGELLKLISADGLGKSSPVRIDQTVTRLLKIK